MLWKYFRLYLLRPREWLQSIEMGMSVWLSVREYIAGTTRAIFTTFLCMLPMSMARSCSGTLTISCIAYRREGVTGVHSAGEV